MQTAIPDENKARVVGYLPPFVEIEGDGVRALDSGQTGSNIRRQHRESTISAIDVKPQALSLREVRNGHKIIDRADIDRAGRRRYEERRQTGIPVAYDGSPERLNVDLVLIVYRNDS